MYSRVMQSLAYLRRDGDQGTATVLGIRPPNGDERALLGLPRPMSDWTELRISHGVDGVTLATVIPVGPRRWLR